MVLVVQFLLFLYEHKLHKVVIGLVVLHLVVVDQTMPWSQLLILVVVKSLDQILVRNTTTILHSMIEISWLNISRKSHNYYRWICSKNNRARVNTRRVCVTVFPFTSRMPTQSTVGTFCANQSSWKSRWYLANCRLEFTSCVAVTEQTSNKWLLLRCH